MIKISNIHWLSESAKEAEVTITDNEFTIKAFCHPCDYNIEQQLEEALHGFMTEDFRKSNDNRYEVLSLEGFQYFIRGVVLEQMENLIKVGDIKIKLDIDIPSWAEDGDYVEFYCARIDLW